MLLYDLFAEYLENYHHSDNSKYIVSNIIKKLKTFFQNVEISSLSTEMIQEYINYQYYVEKLKDITIFNQFKKLKAIFNYAIKKNYIEQNPCQKVSVKVVRYSRRKLNYSRQAIKKILKIFKPTALYAIVYFSLHTGLRREELIALDKDRDFIYQKFLFWKIPVKVIVQYAYIYNHLTGRMELKPTKSENVRYICLDIRCSIFLYHYMKNLKGTRLFEFHPQYITKNFHEIIINANLPKRDRIRFYDLRHIHASYLLSHLKNRANCLKIVQERLGHATITQTFDTYAHVLENDEKKLLKCLNFI